MRSGLSLRTTFSNYLFLKRGIFLMLTGVLIFTAGFFVFPMKINALIILPSFNLTIVKNTVGGDGTFDFHFSSQFESRDFQIQTVNGVGSYSFSPTIFPGSSVTITETLVDDWKNVSVSCVSSNPRLVTWPAEKEISISVPSNSSVTCTFTNKKGEDKLDPVIIIPGILGSAEKNGVWMIDPIMHVYDDLIATLKANGYEEGKTLFTMPYDWHKSNVVTEVKLRDKIAEVEEVCECNKVDIVAHSMGGLVARAYVQSPLYNHDVDQLIFLGTPHLGAPKAYLTWEAGESSPSFSDQILRFLLSKEAKKNGYESLFEYIRNKPINSLQELLPTYDYLKDKNSLEIINYPENYPRNYFLENLNDGVSNLLNSGVNIFNIVGNISTSTISYIRIASSTDPILWEHGIPDGFYSKNSVDKGLEIGLGDGTVTTESANFINSNLIETSYEHLKLPTQSEGNIYNILTGKTASILVDKWGIPNVIMIIKMLSPADIQVVAPDGKIVGKNFATGEEINEIDGAFYSGFETDDEYVTILNPLPGDYVVKTVGTASGAYTVASSLISETGTNEQETRGTTEPEFVANIPINVSDEGGITVEPPDVQAVTPDSVIADIERAYSLGWITKKQVKENLIRQIKAMVRVEKRIEKVLERVNGKKIEKKVEKLEKKIDRVLAKALQEELKLYKKGKFINQEAFDLIKNDIELLMFIY